MTDPTPPEEPDDAADTTMFKAFVERDEPAESKASGAPFRIITLFVGLAVFAVLIYVMLRL